MATPFATLEARLNTAALAKLANAAATISGVAVEGIFDNDYAVSDGGLGMVTTAPAFTMATADVPTNPVARAFVHNGITYVIVEHRPDGAGVSVLFLERT